MHHDKHSPQSVYLFALAKQHYKTFQQKKNKKKNIFFCKADSLIDLITRSI